MNATERDAGLDDYRSWAKAHARCFLQSKARFESRSFPDRDGDPATVSVIPGSHHSTRRIRTTFHFANRSRLRWLSRSDTDDRGRSDCCTCRKASRSPHRKGSLHVVDVLRKMAPA